MDRKLNFLDEVDLRSELQSKIGPWSEVKLEIVRKYEQAYSAIFSAPNQRRFQHVYVDAFAGAGYHVSRASGAIVSGSPTIALNTIPPFHEYHFIDIQKIRVASLERIAGDRQDVFVHHGDANTMLRERVLPRVQYKDFRRGLCLLDPYGMHYEWSVVETIGQMRSIDLFLNFPVMDINMNVLRRSLESISEAQAIRMNRFWGNDSWRAGFYSPMVQLGLFGDCSSAKSSGNYEVAIAYANRLREVAGFLHTPLPLPMRNSNGAIVYYLIFATHNRNASKIVEQIFDAYRS